MNFVAWLLAVAGAFCSAGAAQAIGPHPQKPAASAAAPASAATPAAPVAAPTAPRRDPPSPPHSTLGDSALLSRTPDMQHNSPPTQITDKNVSRLGLRWYPDAVRAIKRI